MSVMHSPSDWPDMLFFAFPQRKTRVKNARNGVMMFWSYLGLLLLGVVIGFALNIIIASIRHRAGAEHTFKDPERDRVVGIVKSMEKKD